MSQDIEDTLTPRGSGCFPLGAAWLAGGLVVAGGVDAELAEELAGG
jgi:hypothetical protein